MRSWHWFQVYKLASFPGPAQLFIALPYQQWRKAERGLGTRLGLPIAFSSVQKRILAYCKNWTVGSKPHPKMVVLRIHAARKFNIRPDYSVSSMCRPCYIPTMHHRIKLNAISCKKKKKKKKKKRKKKVPAASPNYVVAPKSTEIA